MGAGASAAPIAQTTAAGSRPVHFLMVGAVVVAYTAPGWVLHRNRDEQQVPGVPILVDFQ